MSRRRKKKDSPTRTVFLIIMAAVIMTTAVYIITSVVGKIRSDYKNLDFSTEQKEIPSITIDIREEPKSGWSKTDNGWMYYLDEEEYVTDQQKDIEGFLYYFDGDGITATGILRQKGQTYTYHDTEDYLEDIQIDLDYKPGSTGESLDSLVRTNAFWCYLRVEDAGLFKTILYRKIVENRAMVLGGEMAPGKTTGSSIRAYGDYVCSLPRVKENQKQGLSEAEGGLYGKLFKMRPRNDIKKLTAENVGGYVAMGDTTYYSRAGKIYNTTSGTEVAAGEARYSVVIKDRDRYLVDDMGSPAMAGSNNSVSTENRIYRIEEDGEIKYVEHGQVTVGGKMYYPGGSGAKSSVSAKNEGNDTATIREDCGVQSYCTVDNQVYYSSYVDKGTRGEWYDQIFRTDLNEQNKQAVPECFLGVMQNVYYYEDEGQISEEYNPTIWKQAYRTVAIISGDGNIYQISDTAARTGKHVDGDDMLEAIVAKGGKVICLWHDYEWDRDSGITSILQSKVIELDAGGRSLIDMVPFTKTQESGKVQELGNIIQPTEATSPSSTETVSPAGPSVDNDPVISTERPHTETVAPTLPAPAFTIPSATEPSAEAKIVPLG